MNNQNLPFSSEMCYVYATLGFRTLYFYIYQIILGKYVSQQMMFCVAVFLLSYEHCSNVRVYEYICLGKLKTTTTYSELIKITIYTCQQIGMF